MVRSYVYKQEQVDVEREFNLNDIIFNFEEEYID